MRGTQQDIYLTGNPQITFWKIIYRRHTNFAIESIEQTFNGQADWAKKVTCPISRNGDLMFRTYLRVEIPDVRISPASLDSDHSVGFRWLNNLGHIIIKTVEVEIGGQKIDKHYGVWLQIWNELTQSPGHQMGYANMIGNTPDLTEFMYVTKKPTGSDNIYHGPKDSSGNLFVKGKPLYIPLQFWFCRHPGLALPLVSLQYHEVKITMEFSDVKDCYWAATSESVDSDDVPVDWVTNMDAVRPGSLPSASLFVNYVYLDADERRRFAQLSHEVLMDQLQFTGDESTSQPNNKFKMTFNHPVSELVWVVQPEDFFEDDVEARGKQHFNFTDDSDVLDDGSIVRGGGAAGGSRFLQTNTFFGYGDNPVYNCKIQLNGHDRLSERDGRYFNLVVPYEAHKAVPSKGINVYSFALSPEEFQPTGSCNFSRIDNATLNLRLTDKSVRKNGEVRSCRVKIFAKNRNVLRIISGMGGLCRIISGMGGRRILPMTIDIIRTNKLSQKVANHGYLGIPWTVLLRAQWLCQQPMTEAKSQRQLLVTEHHTPSFVATFPNCENILHTRVIRYQTVDPKRPWWWVELPSKVIIRIIGKTRSQALQTEQVQRLYGNGSSKEGLRYSPSHNRKIVIHTRLIPIRQTLSAYHGGVFYSCLYGVMSGVVGDYVCLYSFSHTRIREIAYNAFDLKFVVSASYSEESNINIQ